ncbi:extracellular solute-binding protein [Paenibacillus sp. MBLB4367]|uniref:extracellular solute-binding protein n=1 Tax=Paenibacillus sp. MBLB4367 TaxID=3384767 RepID=UPI00390805C8
MLTKRRSLLVLFTILGVSIILLSQCTGSIQEKSTVADEGAVAKSAKGAAEGDKGKTANALRAVVSMKDAEFTILQKLSTQYADTHPGISVKLENVASRDAFVQLKKQSQLGEAPDIMLLDNAWVNELAALGYLLPVDEYFTTEQQAQVIPLLMNQMKWNGYIWGIPKDVDPYIMAWNKKTAAEAKLGTEPPATAAELIAWNKKLLKPDEGSYGVYTDLTEPNDLIALFIALGGAWPDSKQLTMKLNEAQSLKALESFFVPQEEGWNAKQFAKNFPPLSAQLNPWDLLSKGKMAAMVTTVSAFKQQAKSDLSIAALPQNAPQTNDGGVWLKGRSFSISSRSANPKAAIDWIKEMTTADAGNKLWAEAKVLPAQIIAYNLAPIRSDEHFNSYKWLIFDQGKVHPVDMEAGKKLSALQNEMSKLYKGEQDPKSFAEKASKLWTAAKKTESVSPSP